MSRQIVTVKFELKDGRILQCTYPVWYDAGTYWDPPESDVGEPDYELDGDPVNVEDLPRGLDRIANEMYENSDDPKFKTVADEDDGRPEDLGCE